MENYNLDKFQDSVLGEINELNGFMDYLENPVEQIKAYLESPIYLEANPFFQVWNRMGYWKLGNAAESTHKTITKDNLAKYLCPALQTVSDDVFDIAKIVTAILLPLSLSGSIQLPAEPVAFAGISVLIARIGIATFCATQSEKTKRKVITQKPKGNRRTKK